MTVPERQLVVVDVETNGLDPAVHEAVEVAWWNLSTGERGWFIPRHDVSGVLGRAEVRALQVNRYIDRIAGQAQDYDGSQVVRLHDEFGDYQEDEHGGAFTQHTLVSANPTFDAAFISKLFDQHLFDVERAPWHHRLFDVEAYAAGVLGLDHVPGLREVCELLELPHSPDHTAEGDVTAAGAAFLALRERAGGDR